MPRHAEWLEAVTVGGDVVHRDSEGVCSLDPPKQRRKTPRNGHQQNLFSSSAPVLPRLEACPGNAVLQVRRGPLARVEAKLAEARTTEGRQALAEGLGVEHTPKRRTMPSAVKNFVQQNKTIVYPHDRRLRKEAAHHEHALKQITAVLRRNCLEEEAVTRLNLTTCEAKAARRLRSAATVLAIARMVRFQKLNRVRVWLVAAACAEWLRCAHACLRQRRDLSRRLADAQAVAVLVRFLRKAVRRRRLHRAVECILHTVKMLHIRGSFRKACKRLCASIITVQRFYRHRLLVTEARCSLVLRRWHRWIDETRFAEELPSRVREIAARDFVRGRRQEWVAKLVVYERCDLRPCLIEAIKARLGTEMSRVEVRARVDQARRCGGVAALAHTFSVAYEPPRLCFEVTAADLQAIQDRGRQLLLVDRAPPHHPKIETT